MQIVPGGKRFTKMWRCRGLNNYRHFCGTVPPIIACPHDDDKDDYLSQSSQAHDGNHFLVGCFLLFLHHSQLARGA